MARTLMASHTTTIMDKSIIKKLTYLHKRLETLAQELDNFDEDRQSSISVDVWALVFMLYDLDEVRYEVLRQGGSIT